MRIRLRATNIMHREAHLTREMNRLSFFSARQPHLHTARPVDRLITNSDPGPTLLNQPATQQPLKFQHNRITLVILNT